jgi:hypothetical protein
MRVIKHVIEWLGRRIWREMIIYGIARRIALRLTCITYQMSKMLDHLRRNILFAPTVYVAECSVAGVLSRTTNVQ